MSVEWAELPEERRARFLRLAIAAAVTAAKVPLPQVRETYLRLARHLRAQADRTVGKTTKGDEGHQPDSKL